MIRRWPASGNSEGGRSSLQICIRPTGRAMAPGSARTLPFNKDDLHDLFRGRVWDAPFDCSAIVLFSLRRLR